MIRTDTKQPYGTLLIDVSDGLENGPWGGTAPSTAWGSVVPLLVGGVDVVGLVVPKPSPPLPPTSVSRWIP